MGRIPHTPFGQAFSKLEPTARKKKEMDVDKDGDDMTIAVNVHYLMDALKAVDSQKTLIGIDSEVVIRPSTGDHLCVIMPVRL